MSENDKSYKRGQVVQIINSVVDHMEGASGVSREVYQQLYELAKTIDKLKKDVSESDHAHLTREGIPDATLELDEVVNATAEATGNIMQACEGIEKISEGLDGEVSGQILGYITSIYEACSFQDITGQRITKVIKTLQKVEKTINSLVGTLREQIGPLANKLENGESEVKGDDALMNGPQLSDKAMGQDEIDRLLAEFDA